MMPNKINFEQKRKKTVLAGGIFVYPHAKFLASRPDGIIKNKDGTQSTFRIMTEQVSDNYLSILSQLDLLCSGFNVAYVVLKNGQYTKFEKEAGFAEKVQTRLMPFHKEFLLPELMTHRISLQKAQSSNTVQTE
jgi:hypothetical protein